MPELPEVETIRRDIAEAVLGRRVISVSLHAPAVVKYPTPEDFVPQLVGRTLVAAGRAGKYLLIKLDSELTWVIHLSLEGRFLYEPAGARLGLGTLLVANLDNGYQLTLRDNVSFTKTYLLDMEGLGSVLKLHELGPEPIDPRFTVEVLRARLAGRRRMIKPALLDGRILAGVGNIYADESLWRAKIHPERKANTLGDDEWQALHAALRDLLRDGIAHRGTSARGGLYRDLYGRKGQHQEYLQVFRRQGKPCPRCGTAIATKHVGGRPSCYCPHCQPKPGEQPSRTAALPAQEKPVLPL